VHQLVGFSAFTATGKSKSQKVKKAKKADHAIYPSCKPHCGHMIGCSLLALANSGHCGSASTAPWDGI
jgi:hypothetical protein